MKIPMMSFLIASLLFAVPGEIPDAHPLGCEWEIADFSARVAVAQYEEVESPYTEEEKELCEEACETETCESCSTKVDYLGEFTAYAYCGCTSCTPGHMRTALGRRPVENRTLAVDPTVIPLGSRVYVEYPDGAIYDMVAEDTGGSNIKGHAVDFYMESHERAIKHGVKQVKIYKEG